MNKERKMELYYVENSSFFFDIKIFIKSIYTIIKKTTEKEQNVEDINLWRIR